MATTSPDGIYSPDGDSNFNLTVDLAAMASSVQFALTDLRSSIPAAIPAASQATVNAGTSTVGYVNPSTLRNRAYAPYSMAAGNVTNRTVSPGTVSNVSVTFPSGRFTSTPVVTAVVRGDARDIQVNVDNISTSGFTLRLGSTSVATRTIGAQWTAVQMTSTSGAG